MTVQSAPPPVRYRLCPQRPEAHLFSVACSVADPDPAGQRFVLPAWIPGSYLIRDFARHVVTIRAEADGREVGLRKLDTHTWQADAVAAGAALTLHYEVYAWDLSVRSAHLDCSHAFCNGSSVFLRVVGQEQRRCEVELLPPPGAAYRDWRVATALAATAKTRQGAFGRYAAADYDELIDHPLEMGSFTLARFTACGVPHEVAITGRHDCDLERLTADLQRICEWQIRCFGEPAPMRRYVFLVSAVGNGYGGLEHRASTALLCSRDDLPWVGMTGVPERYRTFLGLCSHEYFHTWNVKRIKPAEFVPYDLQRPNHTTLLWAFEGFTSYYDDLALLRSGIIDAAEWLELTAKNIDAVLRGPGRLRQSLAASSFDAWSKYYRPDENTPNAVVSYYAKGALVALALDATLRAASDGRASLDDVMRGLWREFGDGRRGVAEDDIRRIAEEVSGLRLGRFFATAVHGTDDLPLARLLRPFGIRLQREAASATPWLGARTGGEGNGEIRLENVYSGGPAEAAGLAGGDTLLAIDGLRATPATLERLLARKQPGQRITVHAFRRDELLTTEIVLAAAPPERTRLTVAGDNRLRRQWLGPQRRR